MGHNVTVRGVHFDVISDRAIAIGLDEKANLDANKELELPTLVENKPVREIAAGAFFNTKIKKWCLPATIHRIGDRAFGASEVEQITFYASSVHPYQGVVEVGARAFKNCKNLRIFSTMQKIAAAELAFMGCDNLSTESLRYEMRFTELKKSAFASCPNLHEIFISNGCILWKDAFFHSSIKIIHFDKLAHMNKSVIKFMKDNNVSAIISSESEIAHLAYEGINVEIIKEVS